MLLKPESFNALADAFAEEKKAMKSTKNEAESMITALMFG
jgi:hypothetical protein